MNLNEGKWTKGVSYDIEKIEAIPIEDVIETYTHERVNGVYGNIRCPSSKHSDTKPSATIYHSHGQNHCYCHSCHRDFTPLSLAKDYYENLSDKKDFPKLCQQLLEDMNLPLEGYSNIAEVRARESKQVRGEDTYYEIFPFSKKEMRLIGLPIDPDEATKNIKQKNILLKAVGREPLDYPIFHSGEQDKSETFEMFWKDNKEVAENILIDKIVDRYEMEKAREQYLKDRCKDWKHMPTALKTRDKYDTFKEQLEIMSNEIVVNKNILLSMAQKLNALKDKRKRHFEKVSKRPNGKFNVDR